MALLTSPLPIIPSACHFHVDSNPPYKLIQDHSAFLLLSNCKSAENLKQIHAQFIKYGLHNTQFGLSKLIESYAITPFGNLTNALSLFNGIENPNHVLWNNIIRGYSISSSPELALEFYRLMLCSDNLPNSYTYPFVFKACTKMMDAKVGKQVHGHVLKVGLHKDVFVHTSLVNMYARTGELGYARIVFDKSEFRDAVSFTALISGYASNGFLDEARDLFDEIPVRDVVSWNALISGYARIGRFVEALHLFAEMEKAKVKPDNSTLLTVLSACANTRDLELGKRIRSWIDESGLGSNVLLVNALIDMYGKCEETNTARRLFDNLELRNTVSWNVMIGAYIHVCEYKEALEVFLTMQRMKVLPNGVTLLNVIPACAHLGALDIGRWIHAYIDMNRRDLSNNTSLWTSLIDMYGKCGSIDAAKQVFFKLEDECLASWNAMISSLAMHGDAIGALELFSEMTKTGHNPDDITFVGVLSACNHSGMIEQGRRYFNSMIRDYNVAPKLQHYGCMIDLLGRAGLFDEAETVMKSMPMDPDSVIWGSLLGSCRLHKNLELGEYAANRLFELEPKNAGAYVLLSNIYAGASKWNDVARIRTMLKNKGLKKVPGCTSIEVDTTVHQFLVSDKTHPKTEEIYRMLDEIDRVLEMAGHVHDTYSEVPYDDDVDEECKEEGVLMMSQHSEKLAIAFGLISTKPGTTLRIVKNLRVCGNCHSATKLISKIYKREIIARDRIRFHHFKDGSCSCNDYW